MNPSAPVVLPDGTVVVEYQRAGGSGDTPPEIEVLPSSDGGHSFRRVFRVATAFGHARIKSNHAIGLPYPILAADPGSSEHAGRLYCVWIDGWTLDQRYVLLSSSADRGATWSAPVVVSDQPMAADPAADWGVEYPALAVNKAGVVAVSWYDRRGLSKSVEATQGIKNYGYNVRLRTSLDGGVSWGPSVQVNEAPGRGEMAEVRGWVGMAAAADGRFHPAWISDAGGIQQLYTAAITVDPPAGN